MWSRTGTPPAGSLGGKELLGELQMEWNGIKLNQEKSGRGLSPGMPVGGEGVMDCLFSLRDKWE